MTRHFFKVEWLGFRKNTTSLYEPMYLCAYVVKNISTLILLLIVRRTLAHTDT